MRTRLESPSVCYATPGLPIGTTRASRRRQLPTNQCHAALPSPVIRVYQPDSSSKPSHRQPDADALGKSSVPSREFHGCRGRSRDRRRPNKLLDGRSFHISRPELFAAKEPSQLTRDCAGRRAMGLCNKCRLESISFALSGVRPFCYSAECLSELFKMPQVVVRQILSVGLDGQSPPCRGCSWELPLLIAQACEKGKRLLSSGAERLEVDAKAI